MNHLPYCKERQMSTKHRIKRTRKSDTDCVPVEGKNATIVLGDCAKCADYEMWDLNRVKKLPRPDLVFADPPYNIGIDYGSGGADDQVSVNEYTHTLMERVTATCHYLKPGGVASWVISEQYADALAKILSSNVCEMGYRMSKVQRIIWHETFHTYHERTFPTAHRHIFIYQKTHRQMKLDLKWNKDDIRVPSARQEKYGDKRAVSEGRVPGSVWTISRTCGTFKERVDWHPAQLPVALVERLVLAYTDSGDAVLDPFCGSGTTGIAAITNGRRFIGFETNADYVNRCAERLASL